MDQTVILIPLSSTRFLTTNKFNHLINMLLIQSKCLLNNQLALFEPLFTWVVIKSKIGAHIYLCLYSEGTSAFTSSQS